MGIAFILWRPTPAGAFLINYFAPDSNFNAESIQWKSMDTLVAQNAVFGKFLKIPRITLKWKWKNLLNRRLEEIKLEHAEVFLDLADTRKVGESPKNEPKKAQSGKQPWHLSRLIVERSGLVMIHLAPGVEPLAFELEGQYPNIPFGGDLSEADLQEKRMIEIRQIHIHPSSDLAITILKVDSAALEFRLAGVRNRELDSLVLNAPLLNIDLEFFWFVEELRRAHQLRPSPSTESDWMVRYFHIAKGQLDITRLKEIAIQYPFNFEVTRQNLKLRDLSLAEFKIDLDIPNQDVSWPAWNIFFKNLHGKIEFNLGQKELIEVGNARVKPANDVVNTLFVDKIIWKEFNIDSPWVSVTFDSNVIHGSFGGAFATGYLNGGMMGGWSDTETWRAWGSAANVDAGYISSKAASDSFAMNGRAQLSFDVEGKASELHGKMTLDSISNGTIEIRSLDQALERIEKNTVGAKREIMKWFVGSLRNYPYDKYNLKLTYSKPNASLNFISESKFGLRKLDLQWHGLEY